MAAWKKPTLKLQQMQQILSQFINQRVKEYEVIVTTSNSSFCSHVPSNCCQPPAASYI